MITRQTLYLRRGGNITELNRERHKPAYKKTDIGTYKHNNKRTMDITKQV